MAVLWTSRKSVLSLLYTGGCRSANTSGLISNSINLLMKNHHCSNTSFLCSSVPLRHEASLLKTVTCRTICPMNATSYKGSQVQLGGLYLSVHAPRAYGILARCPRAAYSNEAPASKKTQSYTERVKVIMKEYGTVGVVFHTVISLISLGTCYFLVSR